MRYKLISLAFVTALSHPALAETAPPSMRVMATRLDCGPLSSNPDQNGAFTSPLNISVMQGSLSAERPLISGDGRETFKGRIDPLGRIELTGRYEGRQSWTYRFRGQLSDQKTTVLKGGVEITAGPAGTRSCLITFVDKPADVMAAFTN